MCSVRISFPLFVALLALSGCSVLHLLRPKSKLASHEVDFHEALAFARRAEAAYLPTSEIEARFKELGRLTEF